MSHEVPKLALLGHEDAMMWAKVEFSQSEEVMKVDSKGLEFPIVVDLRRRHAPGLLKALAFGTVGALPHRPIGIEVESFRQTWATLLGDAFWKS
jgi:hypothetical protein